MKFTPIFKTDGGILVSNSIADKILGKKYRKKYRIKKIDFI